jgi:hypothetical protein
LDAAARALADHIERREASDRQIVARVDAIRASLAEVEQLAVGEADDAQRAGELLRVVESELADVSAGRPSDKELPGLRSTAAGLRERLTERRRAADEHRARAEREKREHEEKARRERESRERKLRLESEQAAGKRAGEATQRKAARRAVMRPWLLRGAGVIVVVAVAAGGVWMLNERQRQKSAAAEIARLEQVRRTRAEAVLALQGAVKEIEAIATAISAIDSEDARTSALARCDRVSTEIDAASRLDPSNVDGPRIKVDLSALRSRILGVAIGRPPSPPADDLAAALGEIGADLEAAGRSPAAPLAAVDEALSRADHGIAMAQDILKARPSESRARSLLASLRETRGVLQRRHDGLVDRPKQESVAIKPPDVRPPPPPIPESVSNTQREKFEELLGDAKRQPLSTPEGAAGRIALDRQALDLAAQARGQEWAPAKRADAQTDLDTALVWSLFHKFRDALVARNKESIVAVYPQYPSTEAIAELRAFQYSFEIVDLDLGAKTVSVRETTRGHQRPNFWEPPMTATRKYNLDRRSDGSWFIVSGTLAR